MRKIFWGIMALVLCSTGLAQESIDTTKIQRDLYVVATAHLDTQWRWTIRNTINEYIPATFRENMKLMDIYPDYIFSFEGAIKYMFYKEYFPEEYKKLKPYVDRGQWRVAGSWVDAVDVNMPSFESLVRQTLYGNGFYKQEFGKTSKDILLPDCFGFGYALPSIARHCGLESFSTQKLTWGSSVGVPFDIGIWQGVDGSTITAALNPGDYTGKLRGDLSRDTTWLAQINKQGDSTGLYAAYRYFGTGDIGGSPESLSVDWLSKSLKSDGPIKVHSIGSDELPDLIGKHYGIKDMKAALESTKYPNPFSTPRPSEMLYPLKHYNGELLMTRHGAGCYTSEAAMKRWNRKNELLADATERACVIANLVAGAPYPKEDIKKEWIRFLYHQFHDDLTGTSIPEAYQFSWNDEIIAQNRLSAILEHAVEATASVMDTRAKGIPVVVFNPLSIQRQDVVEAEIHCKDIVDGDSCSFMSFRVFSSDGKEVPSSIIYCNHLINKMKINFMATVPSVGYAVYDIRPTKELCDIQTRLVATDSTLENERYFVMLNSSGEITSIFDKAARKQLLSSPISLQFIHDNPHQWPAWEIQYEDIIAPPMTGKIKSTAIEILETGPVRVSLGITQKTDSSTIHTVISLAVGEAGNRVEFDYDIDWYERETLLKAAFQFSTPNDSVTYDIGLGTIKRGVNTAKKYEVPAHQWADMTATDGSYGVAVMNDCKYGWDHPDSATLRLSLIHTPGVFESWNWVGDQKSQDNGHHEFKFAISGHAGDWRDGAVVWEAARLNQPLLGFVTSSHSGKYGKEATLVKIEQPGKGNRQIKVSAVKFSEGGSVESNPAYELWGPPAGPESIYVAKGIVIQIQELVGKPIENIRIRLEKPIQDAYEINGVENYLSKVVVKDGNILASLSPYQPKAFMLSYQLDFRTFAADFESQPLSLPFNLDGISMDSDRQDGNFDTMGNSIAGDLLPDTIKWLGVPYIVGPKSLGETNIVACNGQTLKLPAPAIPPTEQSRNAGLYNKLNILCAAVGGPAVGTFTVDGKPQTFPIPDWSQFIGQWNSRVVAGEIREDIADIAPGYINREPIAWVGTHRHNAKGENEAYQFTYLYLITLDLPVGAQIVTLPQNKNIRILAATAVKSNAFETKAAQPLYDELQATLTDIQAPQKNFLDNTSATITCPIPGAEVRYTMDGSDPTPSSPLYAGPIAITKAATLKSRAFLADVDDHYVTSVTFHQLLPHEAVALKGLTPGLDCKYFEGSWAKVPDFDTIKAKQTLIMNTITLPEIARKEDFGLTFDGYISIPKDGLYTFYLSSDDGSLLYISDSLVVDNDGLHGDGDVPGQIALKAGYHPIAVRMFQSKGGRALDVSIKGPDMEYQKIPALMLFHKSKK